MLVSQFARFFHYQLHHISYGYTLVWSEHEAIFMFLSFRIHGQSEYIQIQPSMLQAVVDHQNHRVSQLFNQIQGYITDKKSRPMNQRVILQLNNIVKSNISYVIDESLVQSNTGSFKGYKSRSVKYRVIIWITISSTQCVLTPKN